MKRKRKSRRVRKARQICPICDLPADRRTNVPCDVLFGKVWHKACVRKLVGVEAMTAAREEMKAITSPLNARLMADAFADIEWDTVPA